MRSLLHFHHSRSINLLDKTKMEVSELECCPMIVRSMTLNAPPVFISFRKPNHQDLLVGLTEGGQFGRFNEARRNPDNHGIDEFNLSNAIKLPAKMHILAEEGLYPNSVRHFVDTDGLELRNIETLSLCAHVCLDSNEKGKASRFVAQIKAFCTKDPITGEKVGIDLEVRGSMDSISGGKWLTHLRLL